MLPIALSNIEYIALRLVRRFLLPSDLHSLGRFLPFYRMNLAETAPDNVSKLYLDYLALTHRSIAGKQVLEVGSGATNSAGYALVCAGARRVWCVEPYVAFDCNGDTALLNRLAQFHGRDPVEIAAAVRRCESFESVMTASVDLIFSHSVLEHVSDLAALFSNLARVLNETGSMLHVVDYRDHFFKYPLHFLQFSNRTWKNFLNPGDLPRWRLRDHRVALEKEGFDTRILQQVEDNREFERIRAHISSDFDLRDSTLSILQATLYSERKPFRVGGEI